MSRILLVEDEQHLATGLQFNLESDGHEVEVAESGELALTRFESPPPLDLVVLDVMLPGCDGFHVAAEMRRRGQFTPVLMLTARGHADDVLKGFAAGADDYLPKPFDLDIFLARVRGLLRRWAWTHQIRDAAPAATATPHDQFSVGACVIDFDALELTRGDDRLTLTAMEARLLRYLVEHRGRTVSRKALLEDVWGVREDTDTRAIDNFIVRLRRYIEDDPTAPRYLLTVRGIGYRFVPDGDARP
jgi:two-component system, OmpR family, alkaline phosphatase synthesis response regulator PhoP